MSEICNFKPIGMSLNYSEHKNVLLALGSDCILLH